MSYPDITDPNFAENLLRRKEIFSLKSDPTRNFRDPPDGYNDPLAGKHLKLHSHQLFVRGFLNPNTRFKRLHLMHMTGTGKCLGKNTPVMLYDGRIILVQNIRPGDILSGDDDTPRTVLSITKGREMMYKVTLEDGSSFRCNESHILSLKTPCGTKIDIPLTDYLNSTVELYAYRCGRCFPHQDVADPVLYAANLTSGRVSDEYKYNSRDVHMGLLCGFFNANCVAGGYHVGVFRADLAEDILFIARALDIFVEYENKCGYTQIHINTQKESKLLSFIIERETLDDYYGFTISGNGRFLLGDFTCTHNTLAAVSIILSFVAIYKKLYEITLAKTPMLKKNYAELDRNTSTVFILGFAGPKAAFTREFLRYPEFGFITISEKEELLKRQKLASAGLPDDIKHYKEYYTFLKKRITNKTKGGFVKFIGYDEFVNRLFLTENIKLIELESQVLSRIKAGEEITLQDVIYSHIQDGSIQVNYQLLRMFENSLLVCDEIHNTYNMNMKNNRGVAIQFLLDTVSSLRFLSLSATPINNSPTEIVELLNYFGHKITKKDLFANPRKLLPGKLEEIGKMSKGFVSFLQDVNIKYFPKKKMVGETIIIPRDVEIFKAQDEIPYLKFISCDMSELHQKTLNKFTKEPVKHTRDDNDDTTEEPGPILSPGVASGETHRAVPTDGYALYDIVFPNPDDPDYGLFISSDIRNKISMAPLEWRDSVGITIKKYSANNNIFAGDFLRRENIGKYSTKCAKLLDIIHEIINLSGGDPNKCQKIMVYHHRVKLSGVLLIQELLRANNFIDEYSEPIESTICCICGRPLGEHQANTASHEYKPARFVMAHSDMDKITMEQSLAKYDAPDNIHGTNYMILVGSGIISESYDFKCIRHMIIMYLPVNIPTLLQVFGRAIRKYSHGLLPPDQRDVTIRILLSTMNPHFSPLDTISPEMYRYIDKLADYLTIQQIEREINRNAIDADIHRDIIMPGELRKEYFPDVNAPPVNNLGNLYFDPVYTVPAYTLGEINLSTFNAYKYYEEEIKIISYIIKRLFLIQPVWTYDDLWAAVRQPPIGIEVNPKFFLEPNFIISLHNLVDTNINILSRDIVTKELTEAQFVERIFDYNDRYIYSNGNKHRVVHLGKYYVMFPVIDIVVDPLNATFNEYVEHLRDKERIMIRDLASYSDYVDMDIETYARNTPLTTGVRINVDRFVKESRDVLNYNIKKAEFMKLDMQDLTPLLFNYSETFQMKLIEDAIVSIVNKESDIDLYEKIITLYDKFSVIVYAGEVRKYKDTSKQYKKGIPEDLPDNTPLGYMHSRSIRLYDMEDGPGGKWLEISKIALNRHIMYKENNVIVGVLESSEDQMKFKLRKPSQQIKEEVHKEAAIRQLTRAEYEGTAVRTVVGDTRLIERGIVCDTKNKHELLRIMASLGISVSKLDRSDIRIKRLCGFIRHKLIENEIAERQRNTRYKYVYSWWDEPLSLASII